MKTASINQDAALKQKIQDEGTFIQYTKTNTWYISSQIVDKIIKRTNWNCIRFFKRFLCSCSQLNLILD